MSEKLTPEDIIRLREHSKEVVEGIFMSASSFKEGLDMAVALHFAQAAVIRGERAEKEEAQDELKKRELHHFETEQKNAEYAAGLTRASQTIGELTAAKNMADRFIEWILETHHEKEGQCARCSVVFPCNTVLMAREALVESSGEFHWVYHSGHMLGGGAAFVTAFTIEEGSVAKYLEEGGEVIRRLCGPWEAVTDAPADPADSES